MVNHHQHCYSGYEKYKGRYIFYGLGNFLFDSSSERHTSWNDGYMVGVEMMGDGRVECKVIRYSQCNETPQVVPMDDDSLNSFQARLSELNGIISNESELKLRHQIWMENNSMFIPALFEPWQGRITSALYRRGILPLTFDNRRRLILTNYIWCESHLNKLRYVFNPND